MFHLDYLGLAHRRFPTDLAATLTPPNTGIGVFDTEFGDVIPHIKKIIKIRKEEGLPAIPLWRSHLWWGGSAHSLCPERVIRDRAPLYEKLQQQYPTVDFYISHTCEYKSTNFNEIDRRVQLIKQYAPSCVPVNSVWQGPFTPGALREKHYNPRVALGPGLQIVSTDGFNCYDIDITKFLSEGDYLHRFLWGQRFNLREHTHEGDHVPDPEDRTAAPDEKYMRSVIRQLYPQGEAPSSPLRLSKLSKDNFYASHAEDSQGMNDRRENRPLFISKYQAEYVEFVTYTGKPLGRLIYEGRFSTNQYRYYAGKPGGIGLYGYEIAKKAKRMSGSEFVALKINKTYFGLVNPAFRTGYYHD